EEGERNTDPMPYMIRVRPDMPPIVELTKPGHDVKLPANGILRLEGLVKDDFGLTGLTLQLFDGFRTQVIPYRKDKSFRGEDGSYPVELRYKQFVELDKIRQTNGQPLQPSMQLRYWLEATDNCDYPRPNIGKSRDFRVEIVEPTDAQQQAQGRQQAE